MPSKIPRLLGLTATLTVAASLANGATAPGPAFTPGEIRISIKNVYEAEINFGPLGKGWRKGTDMAEGVLKSQGREYVGVVTASVESDQVITGMMSNCGSGTHYEDLQELRVIGHPEVDFNENVQTVDPATMTGQASNEYLRLEFVPAGRTSQQPANPDPGQDTIIACHTLIENEETARSGMMFLPLNDSRWTTPGVGYIIALPASGTINYTDMTVPAAGGEQIGPFKAKKSEWTIRVERLR